MNQTFWVAFEEMLTLFLATVGPEDRLVIEDDRGRYVQLAGTDDSWIYGEFKGNNYLAADTAWDDGALAAAYKAHWNPSNETIPNPYLDLPPGSAAVAARMVVWILSTLFEVANPRDLHWDSRGWTGWGQLHEQLVGRFFEPLDPGGPTIDWIDDFVPGRWWHRFETVLARRIEVMGSPGESDNWLAGTGDALRLAVQAIPEGQVRVTVMCPTTPRREQIACLRGLGWDQPDYGVWERYFEASRAAASGTATHITEMLRDCFGIQHPLDLYDDDLRAALDDDWEYGPDAATWSGATQDSDAEVFSTQLSSTGTDEQPLTDHPDYSSFLEHRTGEQLNELLHFGHFIPVSKGETRRYVQTHYPGWTWNSLIAVLKAADVFVGRGGSPPRCDDQVRAVHFDSATSFAVEWLDRAPTGRGEVSDS